MSLPQHIQNWFAARGWSPRPHQLAVLDHAAAGDSVLLISPTGGGKTLAGFLPSLAELSEPRSGGGIHTLYVSPLKALAVDIARNLEAPVREMGLPITIETRTGDTPQHKRVRQRQNPPDILITTPEQVSLMVADPHAAHLLKDLRTVILDELHAMDCRHDHEREGRREHHDEQHRQHDVPRRIASASHAGPTVISRDRDTMTDPTVATSSTLRRLTLGQSAETISAPLNQRPSARP